MNSSNQNDIKWDIASGFSGPKRAAPVVYWMSDMLDKFVHSLETEKQLSFELNFHSLVFY